MDGVRAALINKEICNLSVQAHQNADFKTITKDDILGKWSLFFSYPADFTYVCSTELKELQENYDGFKAENCEVHFASRNTHFVRKAWHDESDRISKVTLPHARRPRPCADGPIPDLPSSVGGLKMGDNDAENVCDAVVIGGGPAGIAAALYLARAVIVFWWWRRSALVGRSLSRPRS